MVQMIEKKTVDSAVLSIQAVAEDGRVLDQVRHWEGSAAFSCGNDRLKYLFEKILCKKVGWEVTTRLFRREVIEKNQIRFCESCQNFAEDLGFVAQYTLFSGGEISRNLCGYSYLLRKGSMMNTSSQTVKLDQVNEISKSIYSVYSRQFARAEDLREYTLLHTLILYNQLSKIIRNPLLGAAAFSGVQDSNWMRQHLAGISRFRRTIQRHMGRQTAWRVILVSHYAYHQNYTRYRVERFLVDRFITPIQ